MKIPHLRYLHPADKRIKVIKIEGDLYAIKVRKDIIGIDEEQLDFDTLMDEAEVVLKSTNLIIDESDDEHLIIKKGHKI